MTRTALDMADDADDPTHEEWRRAVSMGMTVLITLRGHRYVSKPAEQVKTHDVILTTTDDSGKSVLVMIEAKKWHPPARYRWPYPRVSPQRLAGLAVIIAGRKRGDLCTDEWRSHLSGETGAGLPSERQAREAAGFVLAAVRYRLQDAADFAWRPVDAVLASREFSNLVVLIATLGMAVVFLRSGGLYNLAVNFQNVGAAWIAAFGLIHVGRRWRDVKPPERKPRRTKE